MISLPLDELYLQWLYREVAEINEKRASRSYWGIFRQLFTTEFVWWVPNDDNRLEDGRELRREFLKGLDIEVDRHWLELGCSFLEMLIGLSRRLEFESESSAHDWFWHLMNTLGLDIYTDNMQIPHYDVEEVLNRVIYRTYRKDGQGGLFPLKHPHRHPDQTQVEIWAQLNAYLMENDY